MKTRKFKKEYPLAKITITKFKDVIRTYEKRQLVSEEKKDNLVCISINDGLYKTATCFEDNKKGTKKLLEFIKKELYLK